MNKQLNELKENTNRWMKLRRLSRTIHKDMETLKNIQFKINNSTSQINITIKSLANRVEQVENRVSGMEGKVKEVDQTVIKDHERMLRKYEWNIQHIWDTMKRPNL
jgi:predicted  nucleic acid-binding Zn-ribbon protein